MAEPVKGDIVVIPFPFSDLTQVKRRPAFVVTVACERKDLVLCQITSQAVYDEWRVPLTDEDLARGSLHQSSNVRPNRLFTIEKGLVRYIVGHVTYDKLDEVIRAIVRFVRS
jgi:mRNA interferase MazF